MKYIYVFKTCTLWRENRLTKKELKVFEEKYGKRQKKR